MWVTFVGFENRLENRLELGQKYRVYLAELEVDNLSGLIFVCGGCMFLSALGTMNGCFEIALLLDFEISSRLPGTSG